MNSKDILAAMDKVRHLMPPPNPLDDFLSFRPRTLMGMNVIEAPPPPPRIQLRDITLSDGTKLFDAGFRSEVNAWLLERFGTREDIFKDRAFIFGHHVIMSPKHAAMISNIC